MYSYMILHSEPFPCGKNPEYPLDSQRMRVGGINGVGLGFGAKGPGGWLSKARPDMWWRRFPKFQGLGLCATATARTRQVLTRPYHITVDIDNSQDCLNFS